MTPLTKLSMVALAGVLLGILGSAPPVMASPTDTALQIFPEEPVSAKFAGAAIAFGLSAIAAGWAIGRAGSAGLAAAAERPELRTVAIIIAALGEALAIYGIVIAIIMMGAEV